MLMQAGVVFVVMRGSLLLMALACGCTREPSGTEAEPHRAPAAAVEATRSDAESVGEPPARGAAPHRDAVDLCDPQVIKEHSSLACRTDDDCIICQGSLRSRRAVQKETNEPLGEYCLEEGVEFRMTNASCCEGTCAGS